MTFRRRLRTDLARARARTLLALAGLGVGGVAALASNLSHDLRPALPTVAAPAVALLAALPALSSVGRRPRVPRALGALGRTRRMVVRQLFGGSPALGILGAGALAAAPIEVFGPSLTVGSSSGGSFGLLGLGAESARKATHTVSLLAPVGVGVLAIGFGLALLGRLIAGTSGASQLAVVPGWRIRSGRANAIPLSAHA
jgi:hypothetical protein